MSYFIHCKSECRTDNSSDYVSKVCNIIVYKYAVYNLLSYIKNRYKNKCQRNFSVLQTCKRRKQDKCKHYAACTEKLYAGEKDEIYHPCYNSRA